jgi:hypothetical protein
LKEEEVALHQEGKHIFEEEKWKEPQLELSLPFSTLGSRR